MLPVEFPAPAHGSSAHPSASSYDKAERASLEHVPSAKSSWRSTSSSATYVEGELAKSRTTKEYFQVLIMIIWTPFMRCVVSLLNECWKRYEANVEKRKAEKEKMKSLYKEFASKPLEEYPEGWPQLAAFLHSSDNFAIFRRFGMTHCRVLVQLQCEIQLLEERLAELDKSDAAPGSLQAWRLQTSNWDRSWNSQQRDLLKQLQEKLIAYDTLLFNDQKLRKLDKPPPEDHLSVFHWVIFKKHFHEGQYNWLYHPHDFISQSPLPRFESSILSSFLRRVFRSSPSVSSDPQDPIVDHYSLAGVSALTRFLSVTITVGILIIPVFILLWIPLSRAWITATVLISVLTFSSLMSLFTKAQVREVLVGTAAYCAVLATFLGNTQGVQGGK